jgi:hypothetical protein
MPDLSKKTNRSAGLVFSKRRWIACICALLAVSMFSSVAYSEEESAPAEETTAAEDAAPVDDAVDLEEALEEFEDQNLNTDADMIEDCEVYAENDIFRLYVNEDDAYFGVEVKASGFVWWSSPINATKDPISKSAQKRTMRSLITIGAGDYSSPAPPAKVTGFDGAVRKDQMDGDELILDGMVIEKQDSGVKFTHNFIGRGLTIPLVITLTDYGFSAYIPANEIKEKNIYTADESKGEQRAELITMTLLPFFGAGSVDEDGYIVVPDGSGAVINFNNGKTTVSNYSADVYGRDLAIGQPIAPPKTQQVYLPVIGMVREGADESAKDSAFIAIAAKNDGNAMVNATVSGQNSTVYNNTWFDFNMRSVDQYFMGGSQVNQLTSYESGAIKTGDTEVQYHLLEGDNLSYVDLAAEYRDYLINDMGVTNKTAANDSPLYLRLYGGTMKQQSVLGFPVDMQTVATTYDQADTIVKSLKDLGVTDMRVVFRDATDSGINSNVSTGLDYAGILGSKADYNALRDHINTSGALYPGFSFMEYIRSGNGYSFMLNGAKMLTNALAVQTPYEMAFGTTEVLVMPERMVLSPYYFPDIFTKLLNNFNNEAIKQVTLDESSYMLYGDFSRTNANNRAYINRTDAINTVVDGYRKLSDAGIEILAQGANAYVLPYVTRIMDMPLYSSGYDILDYDIPFYQMVIHGLIPFASEPVNASANADDMILNSALTGSAATFDMIYNSPNLFEDSYYDVLFYAHYAGWLDAAANIDRLMKDVNAGVSDQVIIDYQIIDNNIKQATYANGTVISINTATDDITVNGTVYNLSDYGIKGDDDYA